MEPTVAQRGWSAFLAAVSLVLTGSFAWFLYQARHSRQDLTFVIAIYWLIQLLIELLWCCLVKPEWRRVRFAAWIVLLVLTYMIEFRMPGRWLKKNAWWIPVVRIWLFYFLPARGEDAGRGADEPLLQASPEPEQRV